MCTCVWYDELPDVAKFVVDTDAKVKEDNVVQLKYL